MNSSEKNNIASNGGKTRKKSTKITEDYKQEILLVLRWLLWKNTTTDGVQFQDVSCAMREITVCAKLSLCTVEGNVSFMSTTYFQ